MIVIGKVEEPVAKDSTRKRLDTIKVYQYLGKNIKVGGKSPKT